MKEITEWLHSLDGISNIIAVDKLAHWIWVFFVQEYTWSSKACISDDVFLLLLLFISRDCFWLMNRQFLSLSFSTFFFRESLPLPLMFSGNTITELVVRTITLSDLFSVEIKTLLNGSPSQSVVKKISVEL